MTVLIAAAHPDDEVLGCGGTIAWLTKEGHDVYIALLGEGVTSRYQQREDASAHLVDSIRAQSRQAAELLGAKDLFTYDLPDNRFDTVPLLDTVKLLEGLIVRLRPDAIYTHHAGDLNIDHLIVNRAVLTATRPVEGQSVREIYAFEVPSSSEWAFSTNGMFSPNVFVDISSTLDIKLKALLTYDSEARAFPHPRSPEALRAIAVKWGSTAGLRAAEAFQLIRSVR